MAFYKENIKRIFKFCKLGTTKPGIGKKKKEWKSKKLHLNDNKSKFVYNRIILQSEKLRLIRAVKYHEKTLTENSNKSN